MQKIWQLLVLLFSIIYSSKCIHVDTNNTLFVDQYGRYAVFHGVNCVQKLFPFYPKLDEYDVNHSLADIDLQRLQGWGFNVVRLHVAWEGVQPTKGNYNYTYINKLKEVIQKCRKYGIYVLLDAHQDLYNRQFCGEGFPDWTVERRNFPFPVPIDMDYDKDGNPNRTKCLSVDFGAFYVSQDLMRFQEDFFTNKKGLLDSFAQMWQRVAAHVGRQPNLLGYEILNEPLGVNLYKHPGDFIIPGQSNNKYLLPAYKKIYEAIRRYDPVNLIFYEPSTFDFFSGGFYETIGNEIEKSRQVFSYHVYCPIVTPLGEPKSPQFCKGFDQLEIASKEMNAQKMKVGAMLTEFGALSDSIKSANQLTVLTDQLAKYFRSWSYWQYKYFDDITTAANPGTTESFYDMNGDFQIHKIKALSRPYAYAICGKPISENFNKGIYTLSWIPNKDCFNKNTEIFLSTSFYFPDGFQSVFSNCEACILKSLQIEGYYEIILDRMHKKSVKLTVRPIKVLKD